MKRLHPYVLVFLLLAGIPALAGVQPLQRTTAGHLATEVQLDGREPVLFNVDTGAGASAIYDHARQRLGLTAEPGQRVQLHAAGGAELVERYRLPLLSVAGLETRDLLVSGLPAGISHGDEVTGILGRDVLSKYVVEFDLVEDRLGLHPPGSLPTSAHGWHSVPFRIRSDIGLIELTVELGGAKVRSILDTGARSSLVNWRAAGAAGISPQSSGLVRGTTSGGATSHAFDFYTTRFPDAQIGGTRLPRPRLSIADLPVFDALGMAGRPGMIVGLDLIGDRRFVIDYPRSRLMIERIPAPNAPAAPSR